MKIIDAYTEIIGHVDGDAILKHIELCGRVCYKSEDKITEDSAKTFVSNIIKRGHEAVLEHASVSVRFVVDRGVSHEIVRHRLAAYCQESTRYCNYFNDCFGNEITVIKPCFLEEKSTEYYDWYCACQDAETYYKKLIGHGRSAQEARAVLPNSLKTELIMTANLREWKHFFRLRTAPAAHPQLREVTIPLLEKFKKLIPFVFDDIEVEE